jgi:hypothetical protein
MYRTGPPDRDVGILTGGGGAMLLFQASKGRHLGEGTVSATDTKATKVIVGNKSSGLIA